MTAREPPMRIIETRERVREAPEGLPALLIAERPAEGAVRRVCTAGDIGFSGQIAPRLSEDLLREVAPVLEAADLAFANLESTLSDEVRPDALFAGPETGAEILAGAGFGLINLANNHVLDFGSGGLRGTRESLEATGIEVLGAGPDVDAARRLAIFDLDGLRLGWLGCARTNQDQEGAGDAFWEYSSEKLEAAIRDARGRVDVLAVSIHMGYMFVDYPHPGQRREALALLDAGADLLVMHHAHVLQGVESAPGGGLVCYNLGNLLFDWTEGETAIEVPVEEQRSGAVFVFDLDRRGVCRALALPTRVDDAWTVRWALGASGRAILERLARISGDWREAGATFHRQLTDRATGLAVREVIERLRDGGPRALPELARRLRGHHLRMLLGWPVQRLGRWLGFRRWRRPT